MPETDEPSEQAGLVQCEITGRWVNENEVVTIQGHRVCAEGKAELLERLKSGQSMPGELDRPTVLRRFACMFLDGLILGVANMALGFLLVGGALIAISNPQQGNMAALGVGFAMWQLLTTTGTAAYYALLHGKYGQTLGKMAGKIKVVNTDGTPISMKTAFARIVYLHVATFGAAIITSVAVLLEFEGLFIAATVINGIGGIYILASTIVALVDRDQQRAIHDRLAKTRVIQIH